MAFVVGREDADDPFGRRTRWRWSPFESTSMAVHARPSRSLHLQSVTRVHGPVASMVESRNSEGTYLETQHPRGLALVLRKADGGAISMELETRPLPSVGHDEVMIKVAASVLNPSDALNASGGFPYTSFPRVPGRDYAGVVVSAPGAESMKGLRVFGTSGNRIGFDMDGAHADFLVVPRSSLAVMPHCLSFPQAGSIGVVYSTALLMLNRASISAEMASSTALIIGQSGNVGTALQTLIKAKYVGVRVTGADRVGGYMQLPHDRRFDYVFCTVPNTEVLQSAIALLARRGKLIFIATTRPESRNLEIDPMSFYRNDLSLVGVNSIGCSVSEASALMHEIGDMFSIGKLTWDQNRNVRHVPLADGIAAYESFATSKETIVFVMGTESTETCH